MRTSVRWINDYIDPPASETEIADGLTRAGFPLDGREEHAGDVALEIETTSNRGDCLCHVGLARELAAMTGRRLKPPASKAKTASPAASSVAAIENQEHELCPLYTGRVIRGIKVGPSPAWLADRLRAIGQIPRNNVVDATNFVLFELGQPTHVFDLAKLDGAAIVVRKAKKDEPFVPLGEGAMAIKLTTDDLVIADRNRAVALAGVKGGALTAVTDSTTDVLLEAATFTPVTVRLSSRRHRINSDSSYRFERGVHPGQVNVAAERLASLILEVAGGTLCEGVLSAGKPLSPQREVAIRPERTRALIGLPLSDEKIAESLERLGFSPRRVGTEIRCVVPFDRLDIEREIDLVEEVARMQGLDALPVSDTIAVRVGGAQPRVLGRRTIKDLLAGLGFVETVTHSLVSEGSAAPFVAENRVALRIADERATAEPVLRPSLIASLLRVRRHNQDNGVAGLRLFELASTFSRDDKKHHEAESLGIVMDVLDADLGARPLRGAIERILESVAGHGVDLDVTPTTNGPSWLNPAGEAKVGGRSLGWIGVVTPAVQKAFGLDAPLLAAELSVDEMLRSFPPDPLARALPGFPAIERDLSAIVAEDVTWARLLAVIEGLSLECLEDVEFVTTYRGKQVGANKKSVTLRLRFRAADRTLRHDEVDGQMTRAIEALRTHVNAEVRS